MSAHWQHDDFLYTIQYATPDGAPPPEPVKRYRCACGHTTTCPYRLVCFRCAKIQNVDVELRRIEHATDCEDLREMGVRYDE
jgi:hypothetical protein